MDRIALGLALLAVAVATGWTALEVHRRRVERLRGWTRAARANLAFGLLLVSGTVLLVALPVLLDLQPGVGATAVAGR